VELEEQEAEEQENEGVAYQLVYGHHRQFGCIQRLRKHLKDVFLFLLFIILHNIANKLFLIVFANILSLFGF
jgi:hypothetical protein